MHAPSRHSRIGRAASAAGLVAVLLASAQGSAPPAGATGLSKADVARLSAGVDQRVIVLLANQHRELPARGPAALARAATLAAEQAPVTGELRQVGAKNLRSYRTINAVAATVSQAEVDRLKASPAVGAVVPDLVVRGSRTVPHVPLGSPTVPSAPLPDGICPDNPSRPLLEPEALQATNAAFRNPATPQAQSLFDGSGVKVAYIADGIDINNPDFIRANGQHVFVDYQDFSGDGPNAPTAGPEAFGDASSIASQGRLSYDLSTFVVPAHPLPKGCNITVRGMAPGASLVGLKAFGISNNAFTSGILQAIDYAVNVAHVDVLNESFGSNPYPDTQNDPVTLFNQMAVEAGVTVVSSSGDAGTTNTIGSPASDTSTISVGATTQFRSYAQTTKAGFQLSNGTWASDNISAISSSGFNQRGATTLDVVAPGDLGWALCSTNVTIFLACGDNNGAPNPIQLFGGTSESAPLTAGEAALVIQAYRSTHGGSSPTPAQVKQIIKGTATDLGGRADEQGAGLINSLRAVQAAAGLPDAHGGTPTGSGIVTSPTALSAEANPNQAQTFALSVTNTGATTKTIDAHVRAMTTKVSDEKGSVQLTPGKNPTFIDDFGIARAYVTRSFGVPAGADRLDAAIAWAGNGSIARISLLDPSGRFTAYSLPQGVGNYAHVDVNHPRAGTWKAIIWTAASPKSGYTGPVQLDFTTSRFDQVGTVQPSSIELAPGATGKFTVLTTTPVQPGDMSESLVLESPADQITTVPITLRSLVPLTEDGGTFNGVLTGGNGRASFTGQTNTWQFMVPTGKTDIGVSLALANDPGYPIFAYLISPDAETLGQQSNVVTDAKGTHTFAKTLQIFHKNPVPGRWWLVAALEGPISGNHTSEAFTGRVTFNTVDVSATGVPNSSATVLPSGKGTSAKIRVSNTGLAPESFFVDGRLNATADLPLVPSPVGGVPFAFVVPTETSTLVGTATSTQPVAFDMSPLTQDLTGAFTGGQNDPDIEAMVGPGNVAIARLQAPEITSGPWGMFTQQIGPFGPSGAPTATPAATLVANGQPFDPAVTSSTGDVWLRTISTAGAPATPVTIAPGRSAVITVTLTPSATKGTVVTGFLYVDDFSNTMMSGDELIGIPYTYTVG